MNQRVCKLMAKMEVSVYTVLNERGDYLPAGQILQLAPEPSELYVPEVQTAQARFGLVTRSDKAMARSSLGRLFLKGWLSSFLMLDFQKLLL